jgi:dihydrodipicolinate synthase/N-acetylneuraminate lyase
MAAMGLINEMYRLPMVPPAEASRARIHAVLERMHLVAETASR